MKSVALALLGALSLAGCAGTRPRPAALLSLDRRLASPMARELARDAPAAYAELVAAVRVAERAAEDDPATAGDAAIEAEATLAWALTQARVAQAQARAAEAARRRESAETDAARMEQQAAQILIELGQREAARAMTERARAAVRAPGAVAQAERAARAVEVRQQAELLVAAARALGATEAAARPVTERLASAETVARGGDGTAALAASGRAWLAAEELLRATREGTAPPARATDGTELARELSLAGGFEPQRDERGVIAVLRGLFAGTALAPTSRSRVETLARVLNAHPDARVRIEVFVGGPDRARAERAAAAQARALVTGLERAGVTAERLSSSGLHRVAGGARGDDRAEVVLVLPTEP